MSAKQMLCYGLYLLLAVLQLLVPQSEAAIAWEAMTFEAKDGTRVPAQRGTLEVPLRHDDAASGTTTLAFVKFNATTDNPGPPIIYLAGGPGGSGIATAKGARFELFMALRSVADVIALDQRGTGASAPPPPCQAPEAYPIDQPLLREPWIAYLRATAVHCGAVWREQGVDLNAYTTWESAGDLEALRQALGAQKVSLWGISYGTHLAMAAVRRMEPHLHRLVLASPEGLAQTIKLPLRSDRFYDRVAEVIARDPEAAARYPDLTATMRKVLERLDSSPIDVDLVAPGAEGSVTLTLDGTAARLYTAFFLSKNPHNIAALPAFYAALAEGEYEYLAQAAYRLAYARPAALRPMSLAMDLASGVCADRLALIEQQADEAILQDWLNYPLPHLLGVLDNVQDLGEEFRAPLRSSLPTLILSGTLDGRTFPEAHQEVLSQFSQGAMVTIENAGHDLFMIDPRVGDIVQAFLAGSTPTRERIVIPPPSFQQY
ncbi:MAG: alpha/beta fold hydrolase [Pseudomonadota bacterium]